MSTFILLWMLVQPRSTAAGPMGNPVVTNANETSDGASKATSNRTVTTVGWVSDPNGRGTSSLVITCVLTLGLCVWSAIHLNVPPKNESRVQYGTRYVKWSLMGVLAPELVVWTAWRQWNSAKTIQREVNKAFENEETPPTTPLVNSDKDLSKVKARGNPRRRRHKFTMVHGFYASMGGYVFEKDSWDLDDGSKTFPEGQVRLTLTARGVALLAQCGHLPDIDQDDIKDKSKSDGLGKALVCVQGLWMIMQIIQRAAARLPITLLEFNTLAHVLCALLMYFLWWHKPQSIYEPTPLEGDWARALGAYMYMSSPISGTGGRRLLISSKVEPQLAYLAYIPPQPFQLSESGVINTNAAPCSCHDNESTVVFVTGKGAGQRSSLPIATDTMSMGKLAPRPNAFGIGPAESQSIAPSPSPLWPLAVSAIESYEPIRELCPRVDAQSNTDGWHYCEPKTAPLLTKRAHNWQPGEELFRSLGGLVMGMTVWLASMIYGGLHAMAWNEYFPSESEKFMWRFSSIYIASSGLLWLSVNLLAQVWPAFDRYWERVLEMKSHWMTYGVLGFACTVCGLVYGFARLFLVIEAFVSVRKLPAGAYQTADWTDVFPHL